MNLIDLLQDSVGKHLVERVPSLLGVSGEEAQSSVAKLLPSLLGGMIHQAGTEPGAMRLFESITAPGVDASLADKAGDLLRGGDGTNKLMEQGLDLVKNMFGHRADAVEQGIRESGGLTESTSRSLLGLATPFVVGRLKQLIGAERLDVGGFVNLLSGQRGVLERVLDARFLKAVGIGSLGELFGGVGSMASKLTGAVRDTGARAAGAAGSAGAYAADTARSGGSLLWKILPWVVLLLLALWLLTMCKKPMQHELSKSPAPAGETRGLVERAGDAAKSAGSAVGDAAKGTVGAVADAAKSTAGAVGDAAKGTAEVVGDAAKATAATTGSVVSGTVEGAKAVGGAAVDLLKGAGEKTGDAVAAGADAVKGGTQSAVDTARSSGEAAADAAKGLVGAVGAAADKVVEKIKGVTLPDGTKLELSEGSPVDRIVTFLGEKDAALPKAFILEGLNFETGSSRITADSQKVIDDLGATLKAFAGVKVHMEGHTDNRGSATTNKQLSASRAASVRTALAKLGIAGERITTSGFGPEKPLADNATDEGRARNRRVEVIVTAK